MVYGAKTDHRSSTLVKIKHNGGNKMNTIQRDAAQANMTEWLADPHELGRKPYKTECTGEFELHEMHYYVFKFKACALSPWRVGVSGGYEGDSLEPCGHTFSKMRRYDAATAQNDCIEMVEMIRAFWIEQAKRLAQQP